MPFVWLAERLRAEGIRVRAVSHPDYATHFEQLGVHFKPAGPPLDSARLDGVRQALSVKRNPASVMRTVLDEVTLAAPRAHYADCVAALEGCDLAVSHHLYFVAQEAAAASGIPWISVIFMPNMLRSAAHPPSHDVPFATSRLANSVYWVATEILMWRANRRLRETLRSLSGLTRRVSVFGGLSSQLNLLAASPLISDLPGDLPQPSKVTGAWLPSGATGAPLPPRVTGFLESHERTVLISLGSAGYSAEAETIEIVLRSLADSGCPALVYAGPEGRLGQPDPPEHVLFVDFLPFQSLLPQLSAVVHHGGAGTTALSCRAGVPSVVIPHFADHHYWAAALRARGIAPAPIPRGKLTSQRLSKALAAVLGDDSYRSAARALAARMEAEDGLQSACDAILASSRRLTRRSS